MKRLSIFISVLVSLTSFINIAESNQAAQEDQQSNVTLTEAVAGGNINQVRALISRGADINMKNRMGWTPLHTAVQKQNKEITELLTSKGADLNLKNNRGKTPLHVAVETGQKEIVELLVAEGADVNIMIGTDNPLTLSRKRNHPEIADILTRNGAREPTQEELMGERYRMDYANAPGANQRQTRTSSRNRRGNRAANQPAEVDILADPNEIKARIKTFAGLQKALDIADANSQNEQRQWLQTRYDNRTMLARSVEKQFEEEIQVIRKIAVSEKAQKTTNAIDSALALRKERFKLIGRELMTQRREQRESQQTTRTRGGGRGRTSTRGSTGRGSSRYGSQSEQSNNYNSRSYGRSSSNQPYGSSDSMGRSGRSSRSTRTTRQETQQQEAQQAAETIDREAEDESRQWLQASFEDKSDLAGAVNDQIQMEIAAIRAFAVEEQAKKTTAAIDGVLLARQERLNEFILRMEQEQLRQRQQDQQNTQTGMGGRYQQNNLSDSRHNRGQTSRGARGGSSSGYQQGNQRGRRRR